MDLGALSQVMGKADKGKERIVKTAELQFSFSRANHIPGKGMTRSLLGLGGTADEEAESLEREVAQMRSDDVGARKASAHRILHLAQSPAAPGPLVAAAWEAFGVELVKLMADPVERVRDLSLRALLAFLDRVTAVHHILPVALPSLRHRLASLPPPEPSEEVRLLLALLLSRLVSLLPKGITDYIDSIHDAIHVCLHDVNPSVRKEACNIIVMLCAVQKDRMKAIVRYEQTRTGPEPRYRYGELITNSIKSSLRHKHASVRASAVSAMGALLLVGHKNIEVVEDIVSWQMPNIIPVWHFFSGGTWEDGKLVTPEERGVRHNYLALLASDRSAQVREAFLMMLIDWMTKLTDRWDHESRFLPYLLNGLTDDVPDLRRVTWDAMERLGATHEDEKENNDRDKQELRDFREYGHKTPAELNAAERWQNCRHEPPFTERPRLGARMVVRNNFRKLCPTLVREMTEWQHNTRSKSVQLLYYLCLYSEQWVTAEAISMTQAFVKCVTMCHAEAETGDPEARLLLRQVCQCAQTVGEFVDPSTYMPLLLPGIRGETADDTDRRCALLEVLTSMARGCSPSWLLPHSPLMIRALDCDSVWESRDPRLSSYFSRCAEQLISTAGAGAGDSERQHMLKLLLPLQVKAWSYGARDLPPELGEDEVEEKRRARSWAALQASVTDALTAVAASAGQELEAYLADQFRWILDTIMPVCASYGLQHELALIEITARQCDLASSSVQDCIPDILGHVMRIMNACKSSEQQAIKVDALVFICHLFPSITCNEGTSGVLPAVLDAVFGSARLAALSEVTSQDSDESAECVNSEDSAERMPNTTSGEVNRQMCQTCLESGYLGLSIENIGAACSVSLMRKILCAAQICLQVPDVTVRQLACLIVRCVVAPETGDAASVTTWDEVMNEEAVMVGDDDVTQLPELLLHRVDDSSAAVRLAALETLQVILQAPPSSVEAKEQQQTLLSGLRQRIHELEQDEDDGVQVAAKEVKIMLQE